VAGEDLTNREFIGTVLPDKDLLHQGRYKVNIPELQPHMKVTEGMWCKNHTCRFRVSPSEPGISGSYYPMQPGMSVIVKFFANHIESAYIDRVISDAYANTLPYEIIERDEYYQIIRTPKHNNLIAIYEGDANSKNVPKNSIHIYYNETRTTVVIDEDGINIKTDDNINVTVAKNVKLGTADIKVTKDVHIEAFENTNIKVHKNLNIEAMEIMNIKAGTLIHMQAPLIRQNGSVQPAEPAATAVLPTLINPREDYEYFKRSSGK
jgi:hypothetical protein